MDVAVREKPKHKAKQPAEQLALDFSSPLDHYDQLFRHQQNDVVIWHKHRHDIPKDQRDGPEWQSVAPANTVAALISAAGNVDTYVTANEFNGWRKLTNLRGLNATYLDFDSHRKKLSQAQILKWRDRILRKIRKLGWPEPTFSVLTGRGFHLYWAHHREHPLALPRWKATVRHMCKLLEADPMSTDCCRELRIIGTRNSKVDDDDFIVHGHSHSGKVYDFDFLFETICKPIKADIRKTEAKRLEKVESAARRRREKVGSEAPRESDDPRRYCSIFTWWKWVHDDVRMLATHFSEKKNKGHGVPEGMRTSLLEIFAAAMCWLRPIEELDDEILGFCHELIPGMSDEEILSVTSTLRASAKAADEGKTVFFEGEERDARYRYSREKIWTKLHKNENIRIPESLYPELKAILPEEVYMERRKASQAARDRVEEGRYKSHYSKQGFRMDNITKRATARIMKAQGHSIRAIAAALGEPGKPIGKSTVADWLK